MGEFEVLWIWGLWEVDRVGEWTEDNNYKVISLNLLLSRKIKFDICAELYFSVIF